MDMANLPTSTCRADFGGQGQTLGADGLLGADDIIVFINLFFANDPLADLASPGQVPQSDNKWTADDIIVYINYFFQGCGS
jgi:hypothetical protein